MDALEEKVKSVEAVFEKLDAQIAKFQLWSSLHCEFGCGKCCFKPDIEATMLEFLPFALHLFKSNQAEEWLAKLNETCLPDIASAPIGRRTLFGISSPWINLPIVWLFSSNQ